MNFTSMTTIDHPKTSVASLSISALEGVASPALVLDGKVIARNAQRMAKYVAEHGLKLRPHTKTHKSQKLAKLQMELGAIGLTVAKSGEAEVMAKEADEILVAYPALDAFRASRLASLAQKCQVLVAVDSLMAVESLATAAVQRGTEIGLLVDLDVGMHRTGLQSAPQTLDLATTIEKTKGVRLRGLFCYPGHVWNRPQEQDAPLKEVADKLEETLQLWRSKDFHADIVSGGSTPTAFQSHLVTPYTEIRPGTYMFNDMNTVRGGFCDLQDCAASVLCTVVSTSVKNQVVLDGGSKTFGMDRCIPALGSGHGYLIDYPEAKITALSEEHAQVDISQCASPPKLGERLRVIPNHICPCVNLQDRLVWMENDEVNFINVDARGMLS
jgi:D-serine deaminase-like pyridoxal phosphate-dependent protein